MSLRVPGKWIWDFWLAKDKEDYHIFYLQADNTLEHERLRHWNVSIGHAVSQDLKDWHILPDALTPSQEVDAWDSKTTWTGSIIQHEQTWYLFYTGSKQSEDGLVQRIGFATSDNLIDWKKHPGNPVLEVDTRWYEKQDLSIWHDEAWRDPFVTYDVETKRFHAFITARLKDGEPSGRGVIAHATSDDLMNWTIRPPICPAGEFGHMEVPQIVTISGTYYLIFCCPDNMISNAHRERLQGEALTGTYYMRSDSLTGPYEYTSLQPLFADTPGTLYSGKLIQLPDGNWGFIAFRNYGSNGEFIGDIIDPLPVTVAKDGRLLVGQNIT